MKGAAQLQLFYSLEDENRQRSGQAPLIVDVPRESLRAAPAQAEGQAASGAESHRGEATGQKKAPASAAAKKSSPPREKPAPAASGAKKPKK
jgi:hypothetical protein